MPPTKAEVGPLGLADFAGVFAASCGDEENEGIGGYEGVKLENAWNKKAQYYSVGYDNIMVLKTCNNIHTDFNPCSDIELNF